MLNWKEYEGKSLKEGSVCRTEDNNFIIAGKINVSTGTNDEFTLSITHYTEYFCKDIESKLKFSKINYNE